MIVADFLRHAVNWLSEPSRFFLLTTVALPAWAMLGYWIAIQVLSGLASAGNVGGGVAFWAHVGGFVAGVVLVKPFSRADRVAAHGSQHWQPARLRSR